MLSWLVTLFLCTCTSTVQCAVQGGQFYIAKVQLQYFLHWDHQCIFTISKVVNLNSTDSSNKPASSTTTVAKIFVLFSKSTKTKIAQRNQCHFIRWSHNSIPSYDLHILSLTSVSDPQISFQKNEYF